MCPYEIPLTLYNRFVLFNWLSRNKCIFFIAGYFTCEISLLLDSLDTECMCELCDLSLLLRFRVFFPAL